jgi:penicillin-binding protein 1A
MAKKKKEEKKSISRKFWLAALLLLLLPFIMVWLVSMGTFGKLPDTDQLENPKTALATEVLSADGVVIGKYYNDNRTPVDFEDLSPQTVNALIATEDYRFYDHSGVDFRRLFTIFFYNIVGHRQGASTITQQLAKNLFPREKLSLPRLLIRKIQEQIIATRLEKLYTKEEILAMYLNTVSFGHNAKGIKSAASTYFGKSPDKLDAIESAVLIGMLKAPTTYDPVSRPNNSMKRRNTVLFQMHRYGYLNDAQFQQLKTEPTNLNFRAENQNEGTATYFREYLRQYLKKWADANGRDLYSDGLKIYTTIDSRMQKYAEEAIYQHMKEMQKSLYAQYRNSNTKPWSTVPEILDHTMKNCDRYKGLKEDDVDDATIQRVFNKPVRMRVFSYHGDVDTVMSPLDSIKYYKYFLQTGFMVMEPGTGHVKVWAGGVNYKYFKYDHVAPYATRQVGSTFKPFVYATAIMNGYSPCLKVPNVPVVFEDYDNWTPKNSDHLFDGQMMTLAKGLATSTNCITAWVMKQVGVAPVVKLAQKMGVTSHLDPVPSLCLGTADISLNEMVPAFNTFNNKGVYIEPLLVTRIEDKNGNILQEFVPKTTDVLDEQKDYVMINMLKGVCNGSLYGTGSRLRYKFGLRGPMAGKTGTTQNNSDGWFMGLIPQLTGGVWVGAEDRAVHFTSMNLGQGAAMALPIWGYFLQKVYNDKSLAIDPTKDWDKPEGELGIEIDCSKYDSQPTPGEIEKGVFE